MSLQDTIQQLRQQLAQWVEQQRQIRRRKLNIVRLEDRRLPDATFALLGNALTLDSFDGGSDGLDVSFNSGSSELNFTLNSGAWIDGTGGPLDPALHVAGNLLTVNLNLLANTQLSLLQIDGASVLKNVTDAGDLLSISTLNITGESDVVLDGQNDFDVIQVEGKSLTLSDSDDLEIEGLELSNNAQISATGSLLSSALGNLQVANHFEVSGSSIQLTAANEFGSLQFQSTGDVTIFENGSMLLTGTNSADNLELHATNDLADDSTTELLVSQHARFEAASVTITGSFEAGSLSFHATDSVEIHEVDDMDVSSASEAVGTLILETGGMLEVNDTIDVDGDVTLKSGVSGSVSDVILNGKLNATGAVLFEASGGIDINAEIDPATVTLQANDDITINSGIVVTDQITIEAGLDGTGSVELSSTGSLLVDNLADTAGVAISSGATSGTVMLTGTITADGLVAVTSNESIDGSGLITSAELAARAQTGIGATNALQAAVATLAVRNFASGDVRVQNAGDLSIANAGSIDGTAGHQLGNFGGGFTQITAASPLTIASDITSVGSIILSAGETSDAPGFADDLQINNGVTVSVTGVGNVLTLQAGDAVSIQGTASAASGNVIVKAGFGDLDGDGAIHFDGSIDAGQLVELTAVTGIQDDVAGTISATSLVLQGSGDSVLDNGHNVLQIAANLSGSLSFRSTNSFDVETIGGTVGIQLATAGSTLDLLANAGTIGLAENLTTLGHQNLQSAVELRDNVTLSSGTGDVTFASTVASQSGQAFGLTVNSSGQTVFQSHIGTAANQALGFVTTDAPGSTQLEGDVTTTAEIRFNDSVTLLNDVTLSAVDSDADGEGIDFGATVTGAGNDLTIVGGAGFAAAVSNIDALAADRIDSESTISVGTVSVTGTSDLGGNVTTTGEQVYSGAVLLTSNVTFNGTDTDADGEGIDFGSTVNGGANNLTIVGGPSFAAAVSNVNALNADHIDSESTISATSVSVSGTSDLGGNVTTTGAQSYSGAVLLTANVGLASSGNQNITLDSTVDGAHNLTIRTGGATSLNGDVGGVTRLNELISDAAGQTRIDTASVNAILIQFNDSVVLQQSVTLDATTSVEFGSSVFGNSGSEDLTITAPTVTFDGAISNLADVTVDASGQTIFNGNVNIAGLMRTDAPGNTKINAAIITADTVQFDDAVQLCQDTTITAGRVAFGKTIDEAAVATGSDLTLTIWNPGDANGDISVGDDVGATRKLESITVTAANDVTFQGTVETDGAVIQQSGSGLTTFNGAGVSGIGGNLNITANNVSFSSSDMTTVGAIVVAAANQILLNASAGLNSGGSTITVQANRDAAGAEGLVQHDGSVIATTNASANAVLIDVSGSGSAAINSIQAAGTVTVTAGGSILDNSTAESANVTAAGLALTAQSGIGGAAAADLDTDVASLEASTITGSITISEANALTIGGVNGSLTGMNIQTSGDISLIAGGSITVAESVNGPDDISLTALGSTSDLIISSGSGVTSTDGDVLLSADRTMMVSALVSTSQSGSMSITGNSLAGARNVIVNNGAVISVMNGDLTIDADQGSQQSGDFAGILIDNAVLRTTGTGDVILTGRGGDSASGTQSGVELRNGSVVRSTSNAANAGDISITGFGGSNTGDQNSGIAVSSGSQIRTITGDINLVGTGGNGAGNLNHGIMLDAASVSAVGTSAVAVGDVHLTGIAGSGAGTNAILMSNSTSITVQNSAFANGATLTLESSVGEVVQNTSATVTADNLQLLGRTTGNFDLAEANNVGTLAASIQGTLDFTNTNALIIGTAGSTSGLNSSNQTSNDDVTLCATAIDLAEDVSIGTGTLRLQATTGSVIQSAGAILAGDLGVRAFSGITLDSAGNDVSLFAADGGSGNVVIVDTDGFMIGTVTANGCFTPDVSGITSSQDFEACVASGSIQLSASLNVTGTVRLEATTGSVTSTAAGNINAANLAVRAANAIDLNVATNQITGTFAAESMLLGSIEFADADGFTVGTVSAGACVASVDGVTTTDGNILLTTSNGTLINQTRITATNGNAEILVTGTGDAVLNGITEATASGHVLISTVDGDVNVNGVVSSETGSIRLAVNGDVIVNAAVASSGGHVSILAADDIVTNGSVTTMASGTIYLSASNQTVDSANDGVFINAVLGTVDGDVLVNSSRDIRQNASITSTSGDVGLVASRDVTQTANGFVNTTAGNVLIEAGRDWTMSNGTLISAGGSVDSRAVSGAIALGELNAVNVAISALGDISDANGATLNVFAGLLSMRSTNGSIGAAGNAAIDTEVDTVAATSATGIAIQEADGFVVDHVNAVSVTVDIQRVNSTGATDAVSTNRNTLALDDLTTTTNGHVLLQTQSASISLNDGTDADTLSVTAHGTGNVLIETLGPGGDVIVKSGVRSSGGHVTLNAANDVDVNDSIITSGPGTILIQAANDVHVDALLQTTDGDILIESDRDLRQSASISSVNGDVGLIATRHITQTAAGDITATAGDVLVEAGRNWSMSDGTTIIAGGGEVDGKAVSGDLALGQIRSTHVALTAQGSITDANGAAVNVDATTLSLRAIKGSIGQSHSTNNAANLNVNAIDTQVQTLAATAVTGMYIEEADAIVVDNVAAVSVTVTNIDEIAFDGTTAAVSETRGTQTLNDLTTTNDGSIKLVSRAGSITVNSGFNGSPGVSADGTGDILLQTESAGSDVILNSDVIATTCHITIDAADSVVIEDDVTTGGSGTIFVIARGGSVTLNDADGNLLGIHTVNGNILIDAATTLTLNSKIQSNTGTIALQSGDDILQNANITTGGDLVIKAGRDLRMNSTSINSVGGGELLVTADRDIEIALVEATNVSIVAGRNIVDARLAAQTNVRSTTLRMVAAGEIGGANSAASAGTNLHAIDTEVGVVAAKAANGISIREVAAGGAIQVGSVADLTVSMTVQRANFNSTTSMESLAETLNGLADLTTTADGDIRLLTVNGAISINDGSGSVENGTNGIGVRAMGSGNVLLHAGGTTRDVTINSDVQSGSGHVTITADDDVLINADVQTAGKGTVFVAASNRNAADSNAIVMQNGTTIETSGGNVRLVADREGHLLLSTINASTGNVSLLAEGNILDNNGSATNVIANAARLVTDASITNASNDLGIIGGPETGAASNSNVNAIDTQVNILAAQSAEGIFIGELDGLTVDVTADITVEEVNFNSTTITRTDSSLSDLSTTHDGTIRLQSVTGSILLNDGTDGDNRAILANGTGDILVETLAADGDVTVSSRVQSGTGHVTLSATDDVRISAAVSTSGAGTIVIQASNGANDAGPGQTDGIRVDATLTTLDGDVLLTSTRDIRINSAINSTDGNIGLLAGRDIVQTNTGDITSTNSDVLVEAQRHWTMATDSVVTAGGGEMIGTAVTGTITLDRIKADHVALTAGDAIADVNGTMLNIVGETVSLRAGSMIGTSDDRIETQIDTLAALSSTGVYISEADDLTIDTVSSVTVTLADPQRVDINGSETPVPQTRTTQSLEDVTTTNNGEIHVRSDAGTLTIEGGTDNVGITANGSGEILLEAFGATSDVIANAQIITTTGDISVVADRDIVQNNEGDIFTSNADVLIDAGRDWSMTSDAEVRSISGSVGGVTGTGEIELGQITADHVALQSAKSISDSNGVRFNVVATTLSMSAVESIGDRNNPGTTPTAFADAIDTNVQTLAASSHHGLFINEAISLVVGTVASQSIGGTTFGTQIGLNSDNSDILLNVGQNLTLNQTVNAGTADLRIIANGHVSQSATGIIRADEFGLQQNSTTSGNVTLFSANDVNIIAAENLFDGGDLTFADADDLIIRTVSSQAVGNITFSGTTGLKATGGDVHIQAQGDVTILRSITSTNGVVDSTGASGESILIEAVDGNILFDATAGAIAISTDEGPGSHATTGDSVTLLADSDRSYTGDLDGDNIADSVDPDMDGDGILNNVDAAVTGTTEGKVTMLGDVTIASDGGVAKKFGPRPAVGESSTAFFVFTSNPLPVVIDNSPAFWNALNAYIDAFGIEIGVIGEENMTVDIDWRDPANESGVISDAALQLLGQNLSIDNPISSERYQQFLIANGGQMNVIGHLYTANDMTLFQKVLNVTTIVIDLSVSHHESLNIGGAFVEQAGTGQSVPGLDVTSTDNPTNGFGNLDNGIATFKIPTVTPAPPALFTNEGMTRVDRPLTISPPENNTTFTSLVVGDFGGGAVSGSAFSTEVYFQIRRQFEADSPAEVVVERITDSRLISSREALEKFVRDNPELQDGAGYEIWLISETGGQKVERPVVEFEITGGQPGPASEVEQDSTEVPKLIDLPFEQPEQTAAEPAKELPDGTTSLEMDAPNPIDALPVEQPAAASEESVSSIQRPVEFMDESNSLDSTEEFSELGTFGGSASVLTGTIVGLAVNRFRSRQQADPDPPRYSRAARFRRGKGDA